MSLLKIGKHLIGDGQKPLMFAEEGQANQGDIELAIKMCKLAAGTGADGIEFQLFFAEDMYVPSHEHFKTYRSRELSETQVRELVSVVQSEGLIFQAAALSPRIIEICADAGVDVFCINATDLNNPIIIDPILKTGRPFWLSTLMATIDEIDWVVKYILQKGSTNFGIFHGQHIMSSDESRGVPPELLQLDCIEMLKKRYGLTVGFVDHTATKYVPQLAVSKGASLVMKHLAPGKEWKGPDWIVCLDPEEWKESCDLLHYAGQSGGMSKELSLLEMKDRSIHRRGIYTALGLEAGHVLIASDLVALRPGQGAMDPRGIQKIIGRSIRNQLSKNHQLKIEDLL